MKVSDVDRDAAASLAHELGLSAEEFTSSAADILVQAFARHRHEAIEMAARFVETHSNDYSSGKVVPAIKCLTSASTEHTAAAIRALAGEVK